MASLKCLKELQGTVSVISSDPHAKMAIPDSQQYSGNLYLISNMEDIFSFLHL